MHDKVTHKYTLRLYRGFCNIFTRPIHIRNGNPDKNIGLLDAKYRRVLLSARLNLGYEFGTAMLVDSRCDPPVNNTGLGKTVS